MDVFPPQSVSLTANEQEFVGQIDFAPDHMRLHGRFYEVLETSCQLAAKLATSLFERKAIPEIRLRYFLDPEFNGGNTRKSRKEIFESNGTRGNDILSHGHFLPYLHYFINGPKLPKSTIQGYCDILNHEILTTGMLQDRLRKYVRSETRNLSFDRPEAGEEFFKLAMECGQDIGMAMSIREAAKSTR